jgi:hypothetical protein
MKVGRTHFFLPWTSSHLSLLEICFQPRECQECVNSFAKSATYVSQQQRTYNKSGNVDSWQVNFVDFPDFVEEGMFFSHSNDVVGLSATILNLFQPAWCKRYLGNTTLKSISRYATFRTVPSDQPSLAIIASSKADTFARAMSTPRGIIPSTATEQNTTMLPIQTSPCTRITLQSIQSNHIHRPRQQGLKRSILMNLPQWSSHPAELQHPRRSVTKIV